MATITTSDYRVLRDYVYRPGFGKEELKALSAIPNETQAMTMYQALEDATISHFTGTIKPAIDTALGITTSTALAKKLYAGYLSWKLSNM